MYQNKVKKLREQELQKIVAFQLYLKRGVADPHGNYDYIKDLPYNELPCDAEEKQELRKYAEERLLELEDDIPVFLSHCELVSSVQWPMNLYSSIFSNQDITLKVGAEEALLSAIHTLEPEQETCVLKLYKEGLLWESICDELDMYIAELNEHICQGIRKLRRPLNSKLLSQFMDLPLSKSDNEAVVITDKLKNAAIQLIKASNVAKDEITLAFLQKNLKISFKRAMTLKECLDKTL